MAQKYVLVSVGKTIADIAFDPELAMQYADDKLDHNPETEWIENDVETILELVPENEPVS